MTVEVGVRVVDRRVAVRRCRHGAHRSLPTTSRTSAAAPIDRLKRISPSFGHASSVEMPRSSSRAPVACEVCHQVQHERVHRRAGEHMAVIAPVLDDVDLGQHPVAERSGDGDAGVPYEIHAHRLREGVAQREGVVERQAHRPALGDAVVAEDRVGSGPAVVVGGHVVERVRLARRMGERASSRRSQAGGVGLRASLQVDREGEGGLLDEEAGLQQRVEHGGLRGAPRGRAQPQDETAPHRPSGSARRRRRPAPGSRRRPRSRGRCRAPRREPGARRWRSRSRRRSPRRSSRRGGPSRPPGRGARAAGRRARRPIARDGRPSRLKSSR